MSPAGKRRNLVTIETPTDAQDTQGNATQTWATYTTIWMDIVWTSGDEQKEGGQVGASRSATMTGPYSGSYTVTQKMRAKLGSRYFDIKGVTNVGELNAEIAIDVVERVL